MKPYGFKYSYLILMIFKQIYLTHRWDPNRYYLSGSMKNAPELESQHGMQFSVIPRIP